MEKEELELQAARYSFGGLTTNQMQACIDGLLNKGVYADEFLDVIEPEAATREIVGAAFTKALVALGVTVPSYEEAVWIILQYHVSQIVDGVVDTLAGLKVLMDEVYWRYDFQAKTDECLGDSHGIQHLVGLYWGYDDLLARPTEISLNGKYGEAAIAELKKEIVSAAKRWLERYCAERSMDYG